MRRIGFRATKAVVAGILVAGCMAGFFVPATVLSLAVVVLDFVFLRKTVASV